MPYSPDKELSYPSPYHPKASLELYLISEHIKAPDSLRGSDLYEASPRTLLIEYADSHLGKWHSGQAPRYPNFHMDLPDLVQPQPINANLSYQQHFGRLWLKNFVMLGHLGAVRGDNLDTIEDRYPDDDISDAIDPCDTQASDLHPVGHMVRTSAVLYEVLRQAKGTPHKLSGLAKYLTICAMALHDIGENEHPGVIVETGEIVGDISAAKGKTEANRLQERKILESILSSEFAEYFNDEMIAILSALIGHRTTELDSDFIKAHTIQEIAHNLNSAKTGLFAANVGIWGAQTMSRHRDDTKDQGLHLIGHSMAMAEQHVRVLNKKFKEVRHESPKLYAHYDQVAISGMMAKLERKSHALDEHDGFKRWRTSDAIQAHYGEYRFAA